MDSPYIGNVFGIKVQLHWTFVVLLLLGLFLLAVTPALIYLFLVIVLLFVCVFIHELAHSITAKRNGINIKKIVLLPIGGASVMDTDDIAPELEYRISVVGPLMSMFLGFVFGVMVVYIPAGIVKQLVQFLFLINILLGAFNFIPGFPLDGGRVFRSYLQRKRSYLRATQITVKASNVVVVLLIVGTIIYAAALVNYSLFEKEFIVFWDVLIAMYLYGGAKAEMQNAYMKEYTSDLHVKDVMSSNYAAVEKNASMEQLYKIMMRERTHIIIIKDGGSIRLVTKLQPQGAFGKLPSTTAYEASVPLPSVDWNAKLSKALEMMATENIGLLAVKKRGKFVGIVLGQHLEYVIALRMAKNNPNAKKNAPEKA
ncbi:MAG: site-2 protease family protein [Candidatus Marsarchaeota archaeon]|nr:site-2 protease family protein [Candidatus Marsarchaeota archaeon]